MNIYYFISERLKTIHFFYDAAAAPFITNIRKIEAEEEPYDTYPSDYDIESGEPPFLAEWQMNQDGLTLLGHSGIAMLQVTLKLYLDTYKEEVERFHGKQRWEPAHPKNVRGENWFALYKDVFLNILGIDWNEFGKENVAILEQITLARDDIFHQPRLWTVDTYQSKQHFAKYTESLFADERYLQHFRQTGSVFPGRTWAIDVPPERIHKAIELVDTFCQFMEAKWMSWR
jgi:hypothetical protein